MGSSAKEEDSGASEQLLRHGSLGSKTLVISFANEESRKLGGEKVVERLPPKYAASSNGKQHALPVNPRHIGHGAWIEEGEGRAADEAAKNPEKSALFGHGPAVPTRVWGKHTRTPYGGIATVEGTGDLWTEGDFWNRDSCIRKWDKHHVFRNMANAAHDVHRWDQVRVLRLPGSDRNSTSGLLSADTCFLEMWGYPLGLRDRSGRGVPLWRPVNADEQFRAKPSYLQRSMSTHGKLAGGMTTSMGPSTTVEGQPRDDTTLHLGMSHSSISCRGWDRSDHAPYREAAKMALSVHSHDTLGQRRTFGPAGPTDYPHDKIELRPSAVYTLNFRKYGERSLRDHIAKKQQRDPEEITRREGLGGTFDTLMMKRSI